MTVKRQLVGLRLIYWSVEKIFFNSGIFFVLLILRLLFVRSHRVILQRALLLLRLVGFVIWVCSLRVIRFAKRLIYHIIQYICVQFLASIVKSFDMIVSQTSKVFEFRVAVWWVIHFRFRLRVFVRFYNGILPIRVYVKIWVIDINKRLYFVFSLQIWWKTVLGFLDFFFQFNLFYLWLWWW